MFLMLCRQVHEEKQIQASCYVLNKNMKNMMNVFLALDSTQSNDFVPSITIFIFSTLATTLAFWFLGFDPTNPQILPEDETVEPNL
jgi:hypothetical protein